MQKRTRDQYFNNKKPKRSHISKDARVEYKDKKYDDFGRVCKKLQASNYDIQNKGDTDSNKINTDDKNNNQEEILCDELETDLIRKLFGIDEFDSSKNKDHSFSSTSYTNVRSKRKYRQYMNRPGGFNRPLSPSR